jgi:hypothetical protein
MTPTDAVRRGNMLKAAACYSGLVFGTGFVLGPIRILWLIPKVGVRAGELMEMPVMIAVAAIASRWTTRRFRVSAGLRARLGVGLLALSFMIAAEIGIAVVAAGVSLPEYIAKRDPVSGAAYIGALFLFALMPVLGRGVPAAKESE